MFFIAVFFTKGRLQGHRRNSDSSWPVTSHAYMSSYPCPLSPKKHLQHALQKGATMENLGIGDFIFIDRKLMFSFSSRLAGVGTKMKWHPSNDVPWTIWESILTGPTKPLKQPSSIFLSSFLLVSPLSVSAIAHGECIILALINTLANRGENTIQRWTL